MRSLIVLLLVAVPLLAADPPSLDEQIKAAKLTEAEVKALKEHGFVVGEREYKQVFTPYIGEGPVFVTSDSLLNAFHVLFEESVFRLEQANARKLPVILADIEKNLPAAEKALAGDAELSKKAGRRARVFLGVSRALLDPKAGPDDERARQFSAGVRALLDARAGRAPTDPKAEADIDVKQLVDAEVERVKAAKEKSKPAWLGKVDDGFVAIDYSRFKPRGFYTRSPELERYFRSVSWLQAIPWRLDNDDEFAAFLLLAKAYKEASKPKDWIGHGYWVILDHFLGEGDAWDLPKATRDLPDQWTAKGVKESLATARKREADVPQSEINDQLRFQSDTPDGKPEAQFRFISAYRLPDAVLLQRTASEKRMPSGLDVAAALGSPFARGRLKKDAQPVLDEVDKSHTLFAKLRRSPRSIYTEYLDCLRVLMEQTEPDAPKMFKSDAWGAKTCQTALGSWAQMRHTWVLQAKQDTMALGRHRSYPGFVEPVPEFYAAFADLIERCQSVFEWAGAFDPTLNPAPTRKQLEHAAGLLSIAQDKGLAALTEEDRKALGALSIDLPAAGDPSKDKQLADFLEKEFGMLILRIMSARHARDDGPRVADPSSDPTYRWPALRKMVLKVERLAQRQLRGLDARAEDEQFLKGYGESLGRIMFYDGDSSGFPRDDAPRVVDVHGQQGKVLEVGIGRPRVLWVVYPWKGADVLCRGAVLPYHEFPSAERLTDKQWRDLLDSPKAPEQPDWVKGWTVPKAAEEK